MTQRSRPERPTRATRTHRAVTTLTVTTGLALASAVIGSPVMAATKSRVAGPATTTPGTTTAPGTTTGLGIDPTDTGSLSAVSRIVGAQGAWSQGWTGKGVDVAVIDTGVARVPGLSLPGQVVDGPDLSFDAAGGGPTGVDAYGHGTHMAGIIAGRDAGVTASAAGCTTCLNSSGFSTTAAYVGVAPEARIINVKVGAADGAADVTQVIAAIDWVVQHAHDPGINIRVLNLSYGYTSAQQYTVDPLAQAVEQAWLHGIVVVVSAGNEGNSAVELASPAYDPYVVAVGGLDPKSSLAPSDDKVASFAEHGTAQRPVDVLAPAVSVVGLRVPGSFVDVDPATDKGQVGERFQRGSGTSEAAAVVSGVAALVLQKYPQATPDQVKALLQQSATTLPKGGSSADDLKTLLYSGHGTVNAVAALGRGLPDVASSRQSFTVSTGTGSLDATRNGAFVRADGVDLTGQRDVFGQPFDSAAMAQRQAATTAWNGGIWNGIRWSGDGWVSSEWDGIRWSGIRWSGLRWSGAGWDGIRWSGSNWDGIRWSGSGWSGIRWSGIRWSGIRWSTPDWT